MARFANIVQKLDSFFLCYQKIFESILYLWYSSYLVLFPQLNNAYLFDFATYWTPLANMQTARRYHGCGLATKSDGTMEVVVAGGVGFDTVEIYNFESNTWRWGGVMAYPILTFPSDFNSSLLKVRHIWIAHWSLWHGLCALWGQFLDCWWKMQSAMWPRCQ